MELFDPSGLDGRAYKIPEEVREQVIVLDTLPVKGQFADW
jgi:hypothetical protein